MITIDQVVPELQQSVSFLKEKMEAFFSKDVEIIDVEDEGLDVDELNPKPKYVLAVEKVGFLFDQFRETFWSKESHNYPDIEIMTEGWL